MALRRRTDGMSDDGLSYSVATDFDKQMGQALAEMEARTQDPRFVPGARVEQPDAPDLLRQELLDPVMAAEASYQGTDLRPGRRAGPVVAANPKTVSHEGNIFQYNPLANQWDHVVKAPEKAKDPTAIDPALRYRLNLLQDDIASLQREYVKARARESTKPETLSGMAMDLRKAKNAFESLLPKAATNAPAGLPALTPPVGALPARTPQIFMGTPGATNAVTAGPKRYKFNPATGGFE